MSDPLFDIAAIALQTFGIACGLLAVPLIVVAFWAKGERVQ
jgi:hypothetical protein